MLEGHNIKLADRIKEKSYTVGTGNFALAGAVIGFGSFGSYYTNNDNLFYAITDGINYEVGSGVYLSGVQDELKRFPLRSSNNNSIVNFPQGLKEVYVTYPATHSVFGPSGIKNNPAPSSSGVAFWLSTNIIGHSSGIVIDNSNSRLGINKNNPSYSIDIGGNGPSSIIRSSGVIVGSSGVVFPPQGSYSGGRQTVHYEQNRLDDHAVSQGLIGQLTGSNAVIQLSGNVNQYILFKQQNAGLVFAGPPSGCSQPCSPGYPSFRTLVVDDIPNLSGLYTTFAALSGVSGVLNNRILSFNTASNTAISNVSGVLNNKIDSVSGSLSNRINSIVSSSSSVNNINEGILSPVSGQMLSNIFYPVDATGSILYYSPLHGNKISLYNGTSWEFITFAHTSITGLSDNVVYDIFGFKNQLSLLSLEAVAWSNTNTRATQISSLDNIYVKNGDPTRKYLGTVCVSGNAFSDTVQNRLIWNLYNQTDKLVVNSTDASSSTSWTYATNTWRHLSGTRYPVAVINGINSNNSIELQSTVYYAGDTVSINYALGIGVNDTITPPNSNLNNGNYNGRSCNLGRIQTNGLINQQLNAFLREKPLIGLSYYYPVERRYSGGTATLYGGTSVDNFAGITGKWRC